ncbi:uncharacterized protein K460DRAFT_384787 [Cucurbitaria berberidis CBS 394.84]|uniref:Zn(2)-C6 fungal-type domain-containing protein n=1 Tax=Cucurbitaria berberidis CBS 394.84 TaxID=1168544 RepID=A0A9P4LBW7_9PLEO|nr:uncharacterized protein K460DRAFT_384787 [Cucurbitaria berberidis CBS 394.84]KAF1848767.1 hypothetical protein K460DRAFT_384787 [Cucurbitaria berberidis CBS 394.84]
MALLHQNDQRVQKGFSCVLCAQRKVKCDRRPGGCENCTKARIPCVYKAPPPPRRRKRGARDVDTTTRIRLYEDALRHLGVDPEEVVKQGFSKDAAGEDISGINGFLETRLHDKAQISSLPPQVGVLVSEEGKSRYLENGIWTSLRGEFREPRELFDDDSSEDETAGIIWIFSGVAQRIGQRIGLHRDGESLKLPPFETEVRRRLWWQIMLLEGFSQKLAGTGASSSTLMNDVKMPSNINDSDLFPGMRETPKEHEGATEMMFFLIRCSVGQFLKHSADTHATFDGVWHRVTTSAVNSAIKDKAIDELEALFHRKYLRYCDPSITWHLMCTHLGKAIIFMMRFMAHSTEYYSAGMAQQEKEVLFDLALQVCASQNLAYTMKEMQGFMWHVNLHFQWKAFIYLLSELRYRTEGEQVELAWKEIEKTFEFHPSFDKELSVRALPVAVSNLTLKAWDAYFTARGMPAGGEPYFIQLIRGKRTRAKNLSSGREHADTPKTPSLPRDVDDNRKSMINDDLPHQAAPFQAFDWNVADFNASLGTAYNIPEMVPLDNPEQMNWSTWDSLFVDFQTSNTYDFQINNSQDYPTDVSALLDSGAFSDLTVTCGSDSYKVHKNIVCARGDFFARAIRFDGKEAEERIIDLPNDDPTMVKLLIQYMYEGGYDPTLPDDLVQGSVAFPFAYNATIATPSKKKSKKGASAAKTKAFPHICSDNRYGYICRDDLCDHHVCGEDCTRSCVEFTCKQCYPPTSPVPDIQGPASQLLVHAEMYEIADKYDIVGLKDLVVEKFNRACQNFWDDPTFAIAAHHAFSTTPDHDKGLRDIVSKTISDHMVALVQKPEVEALLTEFNGLAFGLLKMKTEGGWC